MILTLLITVAAMATPPPDAGAPDAGPSVVVDPGASAEVLRPLYESSKTALVQVGPDPMQSGILIHEAGLVVAPLAVSRGTAELAITFMDGTRSTAKLVAVDAALGVALLHVSLTAPAHALNLSQVPPNPGDASYCLALSSSQKPVITFARVATTSVLRDNRVDDRFLTAHYGAPANAIGGAVLDSAGRVIGLVMANDTAGTSFAISARALLRIIEFNRLRLPPVSVEVRTDPVGAQVLLDGAPQGVTPITLQVSAGLHTVVLRSEGLPDTVREIVALGRAHQQLRATLFPGSEVDLRTVAGAWVYVDGILRGVGTSRLWLPAGSHWLAARKEGFRPFGRWVEVVEGRAVAVDARLSETRATLSVTSDPPAAQAFLDDNFIGVTPLKQVRVAPGTYELSLELRGYHPTHVPAVIADDADVDLGKVILPPPRATLHFQVPPDTQISIDNGPRHLASALGETVPVGDHAVTFFAPYQYRAQLTFHANDNQVINLAPTFVAAGTETKREVVRTISTVVEGAAGVSTLVTMAFFLLAEGDREGNSNNGSGGGNGGPSTTGVLTSTGRGYLSTGLALGAVSLGLFAGGELIGFAQPTPDMGFDEDPPHP